MGLLSILSASHQKVGRLKPVIRKRDRQIALLGGQKAAVSRSDEAFTWRGVNDIQRYHRAEPLNQGLVADQGY